MKNVKLKIIAGKYKNRTLLSYSKETRETSSMVRGAVFNMLFQVQGIGLDLFSGSGAYGFEGLSRGLSKVYLNDQDMLAYRSLRENRDSLKVDNECVITNLDYQKAIEYYQKNGIRFDYIFLDPPYKMTNIEHFFDVVSLIVKNQTVIVIEVEKKTQLPESYTQFSLLKEKVHGIKKIGVYQYHEK